MQKYRDRREYCKQWRAANKERVRLYDIEHKNEHAARQRKYYADNTDRVKRAVNAWRAANPLKVKAQYRIHDLTRRNKLARPSCAFCGSVKTEFHHSDYTKPESVIALCKMCHEMIHHSNKEINDAL